MRTVLAACRPEYFGLRTECVERRTSTPLKTGFQRVSYLLLELRRSKMRSLVFVPRTKFFVLPKRPLSGRRTKCVEVGLNSAMLAKTLPVLLCACASSTQLPTANQPEFAEMAQSYARELQAVGVTRVVSPGSGAAVLLETEYGAVYLGYPAAVEPLAFVLNIGPGGLRATAATFDRVKDGQILAALVPEAVRVTAANNRLGWLRANPWH